MSYQVRITPNDMQGRVGSVVMLLVSGASSLGALGTGYLLEAVGSRHTVVVLSAVMAVLALVAAVVFSRTGAALEDRADSMETLGAGHSPSEPAALPAPDAPAPASVPDGTEADPLNHEARRTDG